MAKQQKCPKNMEFNQKQEVCLPKEPDFCRVRYLSGDTLAKVLAGSTFAQVIIFATPTLGTATIAAGMLLLLLLAMLGVTAHYGLLSVCDARNAVFETLIAVMFSYVLSITLAFLWQGYSPQELFSLNYFTTPALVAWAVGTFMGASLGGARSIGPRKADEID